MERTPAVCSSGSPLRAAAVLGGALLFYGCQLLVSARLMERHRLGPVERLLRTVTLWGRPTPRA
ncbi:DUF418 domain-containing protein [Streptomyces microflavus]|uniref:DUF418 domain-containing protein n=1 Tax=Streptomyces microflavus TaxID=1919 RepID=UPI0038055F78